MDLKYANMSLLELKQVAKTRRIKQYYIMKRRELVDLLTLSELPSTFKIEKMTIHELRDEAKRQGLRGFWKLRREQLVELLFPQDHQGDVHKTPADKNEKNEGQTNKHNSPQQHGAKDVGVQNLENGLDNIEMEFRLDLRSLQFIKNISEQ
jgi:hypothetical protein